MKCIRVKRNLSRVLCLILAMCCMITSAFAISDADEAAIQACKDAWQEAHDRGDQAGMDAAHAEAEAISIK